MSNRIWRIVKSPTFLLLLIIVLHALLRARFIGHLMGVDEANNFLAVTTITKGYPGAPFNSVFYFHPPFYLTGAIFVFQLFPQWCERALEAYSIILSCFSILCLYLLGKEIYNGRVGLLSAFLYAILPAAMIMDGWVKADAAEVFFSLLFLYMLVKRRREWAALSLTLAFLSKETVLLPLIGLSVFLLIVRDRGLAKDFAFCMLVAVLLSWWWFAFLSEGRAKMFSFFLGSHPETGQFESGLFYFLSGMPADFGILPLALIVAGTTSTLARSRMIRDLELLPLSCFVIPYLLISLLPAKPPWMITAVLPFAALIGGRGCDGIAGFLRTYGRSVAVIGTTAILLTLLLVAAFTSYESYMDERQGAFYDFSKDMRHEAESIGAFLGPDRGTMFFFGEGNLPQSVFLLYYQPDHLYFTLGEETGDELVGIAQELGLDALVIFKEEKGFEIAASFYHQEGFSFIETEYFLVGIRAG